MPLIDDKKQQAAYESVDVRRKKRLKRHCMALPPPFGDYVRRVGFVRKRAQQCLALFLMCAVLVQAYMPLVLAIDEATPSAQNTEATASASGIVSPPLPTPSIKDIFSGNTPQIDTNELEKSSALDATIPISEGSAAMRRLFVARLAKRIYQPKEKVTLNVAGGRFERFHVVVLNKNHEETAVNIQQSLSGEDRIITIGAPHELIPGAYTVKIEDERGSISEQTFLWGVLAMNPNKFRYQIGETASFAITVLDERGDMVCDAEVRLDIKDPAGDHHLLSTNEGTVTSTAHCSSKDFSLVPDYEAHTLASIEGRYDVTLSTRIKSGSYAITDSFEVVSAMPFEIERSTATRLYPPHVYPVELTVKANEDFEGTITDVVPDAVDVGRLPKDASSVVPFDRIEVVPAGSLQNEFALGPGFHIDMPFTQMTHGTNATGSGVLGIETPEVTEGFGEELTDPLLIKQYAEYGLAGHDGIDFALHMGTPVIAVDPGTVLIARENFDYGTTIIIQHDWGRSYYGHLSTMAVKEGEQVAKGQIIGKSGNTGLSTGAHLHFGIRAKKFDRQNGYMGKIDPAPYMGLPNTSAVLGASSSTDASIKVLTWNISIKKGETVKLGYQYKVPNKSPMIYTLGPLRFFADDTSFVYGEGRQWQLAVDASNYVGKQVKTIEFSFGNSNIATASSTTAMYAVDTNTGNTNGWTSSAPSLASDGFTFKIDGSNIHVTDAWIEFRAVTTAAASLSDLDIGLSTCPGTVATCSNAPVYEALPIFGTPTTIFYFINSGEHNIFQVKANAIAPFDTLSDSDWNSGVETLLRVVATTPSIDLHTAKLVVTYESDFSSSSHYETKTVRFPLDSDVAGDTGSKRTAIAAAGNQDFSYNAQIPDLGSNADIIDVYFEISAQISSSTNGGYIEAKVVNASAVISPRYPNIDTLADTMDQFLIFRPGISATEFQPNTAQKLNLVANTRPLQAAGGELVVTYRYSTGAATQTETIQYFVGQTTTSGSNAKNSFTIQPYIANTGYSIKNIYVRAQTTISAAVNLTVFGDIDDTGGAAEASNQYTLIFTGTEEVGQQRMIYEMNGAVGSFVNGGNLKVSTQWSAVTNGGPVSLELFITYTWSGSSGGPQTKSVQYYTENSKLGGTAATTAQVQRNTAINLKFPETASKTLRSAYVENYITSSDTGTPVDVNQTVNQDAITSGGSGFVSYTNTAEGVSFMTLEDISGNVNVSQKTQSLAFNYITDATSGFSPKTIVTYDVDYSQTGSTVPEKTIKTVEFSFGNSNIATASSATTLYAVDTNIGNTNGWTTNAPSLASDGFTVPLEGTNIRVTDAWVEFRGVTTAAGSLSDLDISLSTCPGTVATCSNAPVYRALPLFGTPTTVFYFINSAEHNIFSVKANAMNVFDGLDDSDWSSGVETILRTTATGPSVDLQTGKLIITYEADVDPASHTEVKTVRFPLDSDVAGDTGSKRTAISANGNQDFSYNAQIPDLASDSDILDVFFEVHAQVSHNNQGGGMIAKVVNASGTNSPTYPILTVLGDTMDQAVIFRPTISATTFQPNTAQKLNIASQVRPLQGAGGELVVTYRYSTGAASQTETVRYFVGQTTTSANTSKNSFTIQPYIANTGYSIKNIYVRAQTTLSAAANLTIYGDIDGGGAASEASNQYTYIFTGTEEVGQQLAIYEMNAAAASFVNGGDLTVSSQWSAANGGPVSLELFITFTWAGSSGGPQTKSVQYYMENSKLGGTAATTAQVQRNTAIGLDFPESVTKTLRTAYVENYITSSDTTSPDDINQTINQDAITSGGSGFVSVTNTGEAMSFAILEDISSFVTVGSSQQSMILNFLSDATSGFSPKAIVTYDADFAAADETPALSQLMRHGKWFNSQGIIRPFSY